MTVAVANLELSEKLYASVIYRCIFPQCLSQLQSTEVSRCFVQLPIIESIKYLSAYVPLSSECGSPLTSTGVVPVADYISSIAHSSVSVIAFTLGFLGILVHALDSERSTSNLHTRWPWVLVDFRVEARLLCHLDLCRHPSMFFSFSTSAEELLLRETFKQRHELIYVLGYLRHVADRITFFFLPISLLSLNAQMRLWLESRIAMVLTGTVGKVLRCWYASNTVRLLAGHMPLFPFKPAFNPAWCTVFFFPTS